MSDAAILHALAGGRPIVELAHPRLRPPGAIGVHWRDGRAAAVSAYRAQLTQLPGDLAGLTALRRLDVGDNQLTTLPALPASLRELYVHDNQLAALPALPALDVLDANRNHLTAVPPLADLAFVYLAGNRLTRLPALTGITYLNVGDNPLCHLALAGPTLRELRAEHAALTSLTLDLPDLEELSLRANQLAALPDLALPALRTLDLRANQLDTLPDSLRALPLTKLDLRWNPLRDPPSWLATLSARVYV
jgi:Leucine-rich repeat (LRR) protein